MKVSQINQILAPVKKQKYPDLSGLDSIPANVGSSYTPEPDTPVSNTGVGSVPDTPPIDRPRTVDAPPPGAIGQSPYNKAKSDYETAVATPAQKQPLWKQALYMGLQALRQVGTGQVEPYHFLGNDRRDYNIQQKAGIYAPLEQSHQQQLSDKYKQAQTDNIYSDNEYQKQVLKDRNDQLLENRRIAAQKTLAGLKHFDPKNPVDRRAAIDAGQNPDDIPAWDDRNPLVKKVGDTTYQYNRDTGQFEPAQGIGKDESKTLVPYDVTMPSGEKRTYNVPQKDAARFAQQMQITGAQISARERIADKNNTTKTDIATKRIDASQAKAQIKSDISTLGKQKVINNATNAFIRAYQKANEDRMPDQTEIDKFLTDQGLKDKPLDRSLLRKSH